MAQPVDPQRQAAALEALRTAVPQKSEAATFWERHGGKVVLAVALLLGVWLAARVVGGFLRASVDETSRAQEDLRRGLRR
ncbi:MAG: hypothetical protein ACXWLM_08320 [Myxococcales bacterium]